MGTDTVPGEGPGTKKWKRLFHGLSINHVCVPSVCAISESHMASFPQANADPSVINCLHNLSRRIATVLQHEERRCQYLTREAKLILALQDEVSAVADGEHGRIPSVPTVNRQCLVVWPRCRTFCQYGNLRSPALP